MADNEVHAELAIELVRTLRTRGGAWRLWQTGLLFTSPIFLAVALADGEPLEILGTGVAMAVLVRNLVQNARALAAERFLTLVERGVGTRVALMRGRMLYIGPAHVRVEDRACLRISAREERKLRTLALPAARIVEK